MPTLAFPKSARLLVRAQFDAVFALKQSVGDRRLVIYWRANDQARARLGLAVGVSFGNAVKRNLFKRRLRELFRCSVLPAIDLVVMPSKHGDARKAGYVELAQSWQKLTGKIAAP